ncbi:MAG: hypothetical protein KDD11_10370 [Acidobacteria bacterium]|nr:hypothetical protein [Acidobacteriota bacterium]
MGVLRGLESLGLVPAGLVGVSMGAVVAATWALREDWYRALVAMETSGFPRPLGSLPGERPGALDRLREWSGLARAGWDMFVGWGVGAPAVPAGEAALKDLTRGGRLEDGRAPVAVVATDLRSGGRVVLEAGDAAGALYASAAIPGVLPPQPRGDALLADGASADLAPVDVARGFGCPVVVAVDPGQSLQRHDPKTGFEALLRAVEICQLTHAHLRFEEADLVIRPSFRRTIDTLDFDARRECVAAGIRGVRARREDLLALLRSASV